MTHLYFFEARVVVLIPSHIDSREHDFLKAVADDFLDVVIDVSCRTAGGTSAHHWDDTVGTEVVASVLNFDETAGMEGVEGRTIAEQVTVIAFWVAAALLEVVVDDVEDGRLALVVDDVIGYAGMQQLFFVVVDHTACDGDDGIRVFASDLMDGLSAFLIALVGDSASVDHDGVSTAFRTDDFVTAFLETGCKSVRLIEVDAAAEGLECNLHHACILSYQFAFDG